MNFSDARFPRLLSLSVTIGLIGAIYGGGPVSYLLESFGYQTVIWLFCVTGCLLAVITYWIVPAATSSPKGTVVSDIKEVLSSRKVLLSCSFAGLMVGVLEGFADVWGALFFKQVYGFEGAVAASLSSLIYVGMCFGAPLLSLIADKVGSYLATIVGAGITMTLCFSFLLFSQLDSHVLAVSLVLVGICCAYQILAIYKASTYVRADVAGLTTAVANMIIMIFGYVFHAVIGGIVNIAGGTSSAAALLYGLTIIPLAVCLGICGFAFLFIRERASNRKKFIGDLS